MTDKPELILREDGSLDEFIARLGEARVHIESIDGNTVFIGIYDKGDVVAQFWIGSTEPLNYTHIVEGLES